MLFDIEVRPGSGTGYFQTYIETVEAATSHDAVSRVQRANPGCVVRCTRSYTNNQSSGNHSFSSSESSEGFVWLLGFGFVAYFLFNYWYIVIPIALIGFILIGIGLSDE